MNVVVTVKSGYSARGLCSFKSGEAVAEFSVGSQGDWLLVAPGVESVHLRLAFDGQDLYAASAAPHAAVRLANAPLDGHFRRVIPPAELCFGAARLEITSDANAEAEPAAVRLPRYFVDMINSAPSSSEPDELGAPPRESGRGVRATMLAVAVGLVLITLVGLGALRRQSGERAVHALASSSAPSPAVVQSGAPSAASAASLAAASPAVVPLAPIGSEPAPAAPRLPLVAPVGGDSISERSGLLATGSDALTPRRAFPQNVADRPVPRIGQQPWLVADDWVAHHERLLVLPKRAQAELVFLGDSITEAWRLAPAYDTYFGRYTPLDLGIAGDCTQNLLWRVEHGEVDGLSARVAVVMIGVNNLAGGFSPEHTAAGVRAVLTALRGRLPNAFVLLLEILPARREASDPLRQKISETNLLLEKLAEPGHVSVHDVGARLLEPDGSISRDTARDFLHPTTSGYAALSEAVAPLVEAALSGH